MSTTIAGRNVLITGANRGLGRALIDEALRRGASRVYGASRQPFEHPDERVVPLVLDVTDVDAIATVAEEVEGLDILLNNAGAVPVLPAWSASKAAEFSLTQSLRALLAAREVSVHAVLPGPIDTDMVRDLPVPKTAPEAVARAIFDGLENGDEEIFPDPMAETFAESWRSGALKAFERQNATLVQPQPTAA